jgi:galactose-1-phosphate uridylyltransferase
VTSASSDPAPLTRLADGTVKQVNPFTGTQVWTVPGRANRPLVLPPARRPKPVETKHTGRHCAFCSRRYLETPPERERVVRRGDDWERLVDLPADQLLDTVADFRLFPNLFEIVSYDYWVANHGYRPTAATAAHQASYLASPAGREHLLTLLRTRFDVVDEADGAELSTRFFAGCHDVIVAHRHFVDGAVLDDEHAGSGSLTTDEHAQYVAMTVRATKRLYDANPHAQLVVAFQNWLRAAGASFDHLHKQLVAIDELGTDLEQQLARLGSEPDVYVRWGERYSVEQGLVIARNDHAVAVAGIGHRYPAVVVWCRVPGRPWELGAGVLRDFSDLLHAMHVATGPGVPTNEEWHHQPPSVTIDSPLRVVLKWRVSTPAGFEGGTRIYVNTIDPWTVASRMRARLAELQAEGHHLGAVRVEPEP